MQKIGARGTGWMERPEAVGLANLIAESLDPEMRIMYPIMEQIFLRPENFAPELTLIRPSEGHGSAGHAVGEYEECADVPVGGICFVNNLLRLETGGKTFVWRVLRYRDDDCDTWEMKWPD